MGAPEGNKNRQVHGLKSKLTIGNLAREHKYIRRAATAYKDALLAAVSAKHAVLGIHQQGPINTAIKNEIKGMLILRMLRQGGDSLSLADKVLLLDKWTNASEARDKAVDKLKLGETDGDMFDAVWRQSVLERPSVPVVAPKLAEGTERD